MLAILFFIDLSNGNLILGVLPESLALLLFGIALVGSTLVLRRVLTRRDRADIQDAAVATAEDSKSF
jgi:hypothetical protein